MVELEATRAQGETPTGASSVDAPAVSAKRGTRRDGSAKKSTPPPPPPKSKYRLYIPIASCTLPVMHVQPTATVSELPQTLGVPWSVSNHADSMHSSVSFSFVYLPALAGPSDAATNPWAAYDVAASSKVPDSDHACISPSSSVSLQTADLSRLHLWALVLRTSPNLALKLPAVVADPLLSR